MSGFYKQEFSATDDADWFETIELIDNDTSGPLAEAATATYALEVKDCGCAVLTASTAGGTIEQPDDNVIQWRFPATQMSGLCTGKTYDVGLTMTTTEGTIQLLVGTLAVIDGGF